MYQDDEYLALSGIQHFAFCRRQWALIHIDQAWSDNGLTAQGNIAHERAHDEGLRERRGDTLVVRGLFVRSPSLGVAGKCDVVEFHKDAAGHPLCGEEGLWRPVPVEYKHGRAKAGNEDRLQLCCQAICLEEMFATDIAMGCLYYASTHSRERVDLTEDLRAEVREAVAEMHQLYARRHIPKVRSRPSCKACSLVELCAPRVSGASVAKYIDETVGVPR